MIDVARIDHWAANGSGPLHRASVPAKILFILLVVASAVLARRPEPLGVAYALLVLSALFAGLPWLAIGLLSLYAAVFAILYALSLRGGLAAHAVLLLKAVTPAYAVGMVITTTPYPNIFSFLNTFLPEVLAAGLFMTYRSFFILLDMMHNFGTSIRLRGGFSPGSLMKNGANIARGIATLLVRAVERSTRLYAVMAVRGYNGKMAEASFGKPGLLDGLPLGLGFAVLTLVVAWS